MIKNNISSSDRGGLKVIKRMLRPKIKSSSFLYSSVS